MTETTTQPHPQVVAWMRGYRSTLPERLDLVSMRLRTIKAYRGAHTDCSLSLADLGDAYREAARKPLTVADIPAGQGAASLYIGPGRYGELAVMYRTGLAHDHVFMTEGPDDPSEARRAMWDHLAATLPIIDASEETQ